MSVVVEGFKGLGRDIKNAAINPKGIENPERLSKFCQSVKIISVIATIAAVAAAIFTGPLGLIFAALFGVVMHDAYKIANNIQKIAEDKQAGKPIPRPSTALEFTNNLSRGTIFAKPIMRAVAKKYFC